MNFKLPKNKQGIIIDILMILANIFVFPIFAMRIDALFAAAFENQKPAFLTIGVLMIVLLVGRIGGLYLKRFPLQARVRSSMSDFSAKFLFVSMPVTILSAIGGWVAIQYFLVGLGVIPTDTAGDPVESQVMTIVMIIVVMFLAVFEVYLLFRLGKRLTAKESSSAARSGLLYGRTAEFVADTGLFAYVFVWQVIYYGIAAWVLRPPVGPPDIGVYVIKYAAMVLIFTQLYLSPRAVFLAEDRKYASTWLFILAAFLSSLLPHWLQQYTGLIF